MNDSIKFGSVCSGIEAASVAWEPLGMSADWFAEIEPFPCAVLAHHWPWVPNYGDMTILPDAIRMGLASAPDILVGGTPCQAYSVAGKRESLDDARGQLTLTYVDIANAIDEQRSKGDECVTVWENVPGVLSTHDNAFGCFLGDLAGSGEILQPGEPPALGKSSDFWRWDKKRNVHLPKWPNSGRVSGPQRSIAWRVLDAQYFGVAQPRRRVFVVASARKDFDAGKVLLESEGERRDIKPSQETEQACTPFTASSFAGYTNRIGTLTASGGDVGGGSDTIVVVKGRVRKLLPVECERLQGFPDNHTQIPYRNKAAEDCPDGPRYKACGNSKAVPCVQWLGLRIMLELEGLL